MGSTGIAWGPWSSKARLGIQFRWDDIGAGTTQSHVYCDVYYGTNAYGYSGNYTLSCNYGNVSYTFYSPTGGSVTTLIKTYDLGVQGTSYGGGPSWTCSASTGPLFDGAKPSVQSSFTLPARPASPPDPPGLSIQSITAASAAIIVSAPANNNGAGVDWYGAWVALDSGFASVVASAAGGSFTASGLVRRTTYWARTQCHNAAGYSTYTTTSFVTDYTAPGAPTGLAVAQVPGDPTKLRATWAAPADNGGSAITSYTVQYATNSSFSGAGSVSAAGTSVDIAGLTPGVNYWFRVSATNAPKGPGPYSATATAQTLVALYEGVADAWVPGVLYEGVDGAWVAIAGIYEGRNGVWAS